MQSVHIIEHPQCVATNAGDLSSNGQKQTWHIEGEGEDDDEDDEERASSFIRLCGEAEDDDDELEDELMTTSPSPSNFCSESESGSIKSSMNEYFKMVDSNSLISPGGCGCLFDTACHSRERGCLMFLREK